MDLTWNRRIPRLDVWNPLRMGFFAASCRFQRGRIPHGYVEVRKFRELVKFVQVRDGKGRLTPLNV